jgi:molybdate transport system substrate-binding protein
MKKMIIIWFLLCNSLFAGTITIAVAANVSYAMDDLKKAFHELHPEIKGKTILGSSGKLPAQIKHGAPYQLFMSANMKYPEALYAEKIAVSEPKVYAEGTLALFSVKNHDFSKGLGLLKERDIQKIAVANPKTAPYGIAADEALRNAGLYEDIKNKFIFGESISQTVSYAVTAADIGIIATSSLYSRQMQKYKKNVHWKEIDPTLYTPIKQGIVILKNAKSDLEVKAFYDFILSADAQKILRQFGYRIP